MKSLSIRYVPKVSDPQELEAIEAALAQAASRTSAAHISTNSRKRALPESFTVHATAHAVHADLPPLEPVRLLLLSAHLHPRTTRSMFTMQPFSFDRVRRVSARRGWGWTRTHSDFATIGASVCRGWSTWARLHGSACNPSSYPTAAACNVRCRCHFDALVRCLCAHCCHSDVRCCHFDALVRCTVHLCAPRLPPIPRPVPPPAAGVPQTENRQREVWRLGMQAPECRAADLRSCRRIRIVAML